MCMYTSLLRVADLLRSSSIVFFFSSMTGCSQSPPHRATRKLPAYVTPVETLVIDENSKVHVTFILLVCTCLLVRGFKKLSECKSVVLITYLISAKV